METPPPVDSPQPLPPPEPASAWNSRVALVTACVIAALILSYGLASYYGGFWPFVRTSQNATPSVVPDESDDSTADWKTYADTDIGFEFNYPPTFGDAQGDVGTGGLTFTHEGLPEETNARDVVLRVQRTAATEAACTSGPEQAIASGSFDVNDQLWYQFTYGDAGAGNFYSTQEYRTFHERRCYGVSVTVHTVNPDAFAETEQPEVFNPEPLWNQLRRAVSTFRFFGSMAGWRTYISTQYGFEFRYPPEHTIVTDKQGWPNAILLLYNGGQAYDIAVEIWDREGAFEERYHEIPSINWAVGDHWLTVYNITHEPGNEQIIASFKFNR